MFQLLLAAIWHLIEICLLIFLSVSSRNPQYPSGVCLEGVTLFMEASEIHRATSRCRRSTDLTEGRMMWIPYRRWYSKRVRKRLRIPRKPFQNGNVPHGGKIPMKNFKANRKSLNRQQPQMTLRPDKTCGLFKETWCTSCSTYVPKEETLPIPLKIFWRNKIHSHQSGRHARKRIEDYWNGRWKQKFGRFVDWFHKITALKKKPPKGFLWSRERLTKAPTPTRPDHVLPAVWTNLSKAAQMREKQELAVEKPEARECAQWQWQWHIRMRSPQSVTWPYGLGWWGPEQHVVRLQNPVRDVWEEFTSLIRETKHMKRPLRMQDGKLEVHMESAMPCKKINPSHSSLSGSCSMGWSTQQSSEDKVRLCGGVLMNPQDSEWKQLFKEVTKTTSQGKGENWMNHFN